MINHARTLLMNEQGERVPAGAHAAEAYIPRFSPVALPTALAWVYATLYGDDPDYEGRLYRTAQYLSILHGTRYAEYMTSLDPRITYDPDAPGLFLQSYGASVTTTGAASLTVIGDWVEPVRHGRVRNDWVVSVSGSSVILRHMRTHTEQSELLTLGSGGASELLALPRSDLRVRIVVPGALMAQRWDILHRTRPSLDAGVTLAALTGISGSSHRALFGTSQAEPYTSFRKMFEDGQYLPIRMSGALLALIYRMEALRNP